MAKKVRCPRPDHKDNNPSVEVYEDHGFCFSQCGRIELAEMGLDKPGKVVERYREDVKAKMAYILSLPVKEFRGFPLPYDNFGYYLVWPKLDYYKLRVLDPNAKTKYRGPAGHRTPLFWARRAGKEVLCVVEGEFEALSVAAAIPEWDVVSPGGVTQFISDSYLTQFKRYAKVVIATDNDAPGIKAARELTEALTYKVPHLVRIYKSVEKDFNDIFCEQGREALRGEIEKQLPQVQEAACGGQGSR